MDDAAPASPRASSLLLAAALLLIAAWYALTLREGHAWGGDNAMYVLHARNLLSGMPYADTGYLYNPASGRFPVSYPPVFPLLLAPLVAHFGVVWAPLKLATIACLITGLGLLVAHEARRLRRAEAVALIVLVGSNPVLWDFKDNVLSEYPFLMFLSAALYLADRFRGRPDGPQAIGAGLLLGVATYLAYGTRTVGALLIPALFAAEMGRGDRPHQRTWIATAVFVTLAGLQNILLHSDAGHLMYKLAIFDPAVPLKNLFVHYPQLFHHFWSSGEPLEVLGVALAGTAAALILFGLGRRIRSRDLDTLDYFVLGSVGFFLLIRLDDMNPPERYWIPLFPLFVVQLLRGFSFFDPPVRSRLLAVFATLSLVAYASSFRALERHEIQNGITSADAQELYTFVRSQTEPDDTLIFFEPRVLTLYTGRRVSELPATKDQTVWMEYARSIGARYWIRPGGLPRRYQDTLTMVFANDTFSVFRFDGDR